ncbi:MAG: hypothetical protein ACE368_08915 [Paracoccaceae bacterium]
MLEGLSRRPAASLRAAALGLSVMCLPAAALAVDVTVGGVTYTLTSVNTSYNTNVALLESQPWWGDAALAVQIINQLLLDGGNSNDIGSGIVDFAIDIGGTVPGGVTAETVSGALGPFSGTLGPASFFDYATATIAGGPAAVPEIDGAALSKALFVLFAFWAWLVTGRGRRAARAKA